MSIDHATIRELIDFSDEHGVLSFYVGHTPAQAADPQPTAPIEIRNQIKQLKGKLASAEPATARAVTARLDRIDGELDALLDPKAPGRGRALFVAVDSGDSRTVSLQIPFRERVIHNDSAYVRPLVAAHDEGREAGVLVVSRAGARVLSWAVGEVTELTSHDFELTDAQLADQKSGPSPSNPEHPHHGFVNRERFEDRVDENHQRFLREVCEQVAAQAKEHGWDRLVLSGAPKVRDLARDLLSSENGLRVVVADQSWEDAAPHQIADQAWPLLRSLHREREHELVTIAVERALGGGTGAVGLRRVCDALNEGRVSRLLYDSELQLEGYRSAEDTVHPRVEGVVAQSDVPLRREPLFVERLIVKAVTMGASVTPIEPDASDALAPYEGVAALLRW